MTAFARFLASYGLRPSDLVFFGVVLFLVLLCGLLWRAAARWTIRNFPISSAAPSEEEAKAAEAAAAAATATLAVTMITPPHS